MTTLVLLTLLGGVDSLTKVTINGLSLKAPVEWQKTESDSGKQWVAPGEAATLAVDVFPVDPSRPAKACVKQLVEAVAKDGFDKFEDLTIGVQPAAKRVMTDYVGEGDEAKKDENKATSTMLLGCNGKTKWVLTYTSKNKDAVRFGPILKRIIESISYGK